MSDERRTDSGRLRLVMCTDGWDENMSLTALRSFCCR